MDGMVDRIFNLFKNKNEYWQDRCKFNVREVIRLGKLVNKLQTRIHRHKMISRRLRQQNKINVTERSIQDILEWHNVGEDLWKKR